MRSKILYKYTREDGGVTVSPVMPQGEYQTLLRLIADDGMAVTQDGVNLYSCIDTDSKEGWCEIEVDNE